MRADVKLDKKIKKKKLKLNYQISTDKLYKINHIAYHIDDLRIQEIIDKDSLNSQLYAGMPFNIVTLDAERQRITKLLQ